MSHTLRHAERARGPNRGGCGGGYESTDPDYDAKRLRQLRDDYNGLDARWHRTFLDGLSRFEQDFVLGKVRT